MFLAAPFDAKQEYKAPAVCRKMTRRLSYRGRKQEYWSLLSTRVGAMSIVVSPLRTKIASGIQQCYQNRFWHLPLPVDSQLPVDATLLYRYYGPANEPILNDMTSTITNLNVVWWSILESEAGAMDADQFVGLFCDALNFGRRGKTNGLYWNVTGAWLKSACDVLPPDRVNCRFVLCVSHKTVISL